MKLTINPIPYKVECKNLDDAKKRFNHLSEITYKKIDGTFNALFLQDNQFFIECENKKYFLATVN
jgi:hypothetical protein